MYKCNICDSTIEQDNGDIVGFFGICQVAFCVWCYSSLWDMFKQLEGLDDIDVLREMINDIIIEKECENGKKKNDRP